MIEITITTKAGEKLEYTRPEFAKFLRHFLSTRAWLTEAERDLIAAETNVFLSAYEEEVGG